MRAKGGDPVLDWAGAAAARNGSREVTMSEACIFLFLCQLDGFE